MTTRRLLPLLLLVGLAGCARRGTSAPREEAAIQQPAPQPPPPDHRVPGEEPPPFPTPVSGTDPAASDKNVFFYEDFETDAFRKRFTGAYAPKNFSSSSEFVLMGKRSLRVQYRDATNFGGSLNYHFGKVGRAEPEELYARYYLRFSENFHVGDGGKLPGPAGTYGVAGWGDRAADGYNGWSARMGFLSRGDQVVLTCYVYQTGSQRSGRHYRWLNQYRGVLQKGRWYCIENYIKLNQPGVADGVLRGWVDGELAFEGTNFKFRMTPRLKIQEYWINHYYGGMVPVPHEQFVYMDNLALSTQRIGIAH